MVPLLPYGIAYNSESYALGFIAATAAAISLSYALFSRRMLAGNLFVGALLPWLILMILTSLFVAGASFMFVWPLLAGLLSPSWLFMRRESLTDTGEAVLWILPAIVAILVFGSTPYMVLMLLSTSGLIPLALAVGLLIGVLTPHLRIISAPKRWLVPAGAGIVTLGFWGYAVSHRGYSSANPRADSVFYVFDADNGKAIWASADLQPDKWTSQFLTGVPGKANLSEYGMAKVLLLTSQARVFQFLPAEVTILADQRIGDARALELKVSPRGARVARLCLENAKVLDASINGRKIDSPSSENVEWRLVCVGFPEEGFKLTLRLAGSATPVLSVVVQNGGLPSLPGRAITPRPDDLVPPASGPYAIGGNGLTGFRIYLDDKLIARFENVHHTVKTYENVNLQKGQSYKLKVEYYEKAGDALMQLLWSVPGRDLEKEAVEAVKQGGCRSHVHGPISTA